MKIMESIPNISEGRRPEVIAYIATKVREVDRLQDGKRKGAHPLCKNESHCCRKRSEMDGVVGNVLSNRGEHY